MRTRLWRIAKLSLLIWALGAVGCAKQPSSTSSSAPSPRSGGPGGSEVMYATERTAWAARLSPKDFVSVTDLKDIHFEFDKSDVNPAAAKILDANAEWLKSNATYLLLIEGHADERGTNEYNLALGERRARSTLNYLVAHGVASSRVSVISYGEERGVCQEHAEACWSKNRRAHFGVKPN